MRLVEFLTVAACAVALTGGCHDGATPQGQRDDSHPARIAVALLEVPTTLVIPWWSRIETSFLHDALVASLVRSGALDVVERTRIDAILAEQKLTRDAFTDPANAARLGKLLGADYLVVGTLVDASVSRGGAPIPYTGRSEQSVDARVAFDFRVIGVETGVAIVAGRAEGNAAERSVETGDSRRLWEAAQEYAAADFTAQVVDAVAPITVASIDGDVLRLDGAAAERVDVGEAFEIYPARRRRAVDGPPVVVGRAEVTSVGEEGARARITERVGEVRAGMTLRRPLPAPPLPPEARSDPAERRW